MMPRKKTFVGAALVFVLITGLPAPLLAGAPAGALPPDVDLVKKRLVASLTETVPAAARIRNLMASMERGRARSGRYWPGRYWPDINYESKQRSPWPVKKHVSRLVDMAVAWRAPSSPWQGHSRLREHIERGLAYWLARDLSTETWAPNWFTREIAVPRCLGELGLLMEGHLSEEVWQKLLQRTAQAKAGRKGQNWVWKSAAAALHGLLTEDADKVERHIGYIFRNLKVTTSQGLQADWSFQQHGPQFQMGNYGLSFAGSMSKWLLMTRDTRFAPPERKVRLLRNFLLRGQAWEAYRGAYDLNGAGRQIIWVTGTEAERPVSLAKPVERMMQIDATHREAYENILRSIRCPTQPSALAGNQWWWRSEVMVHRRPDWAVSLKMSSERVMPHEYGNNENVRGGLLGLGSMFQYTDGRDDYAQIPEVWSWRRIPGTTAGRSRGPLRPMNLWGSYPNVARFSGGVSDGQIGAAAMEMMPEAHEQVQQIHSRKSWFFFDDAYVILGKVLEADLSDEIVTTLSQEALDAPPTVIGAGGERPLSGERPLKGETVDLPGGTALVHEQTAYVFPEPTTLLAHGGPMTGSWYRAYPKPEETALKEKATREVFMLAVSHGAAAEPRPSLSSIIFPTGGKATAQAFLGAPWIQILRNDRKVQAVRHEKAGRVQAAFFEADELALGEGITLKLTSPALLMLRRRAGEAPGGYDVYLADPLKSKKTLVFSLSGAYALSKEAQQADTKIQITTTDGSRTQVIVEMPQAESARGRPVRLRLRPSRL